MDDRGRIFTEEELGMMDDKTKKILKHPPKKMTRLTQDEYELVSKMNRADRRKWLRSNKK